MDLTVQNVYGLLLRSKLLSLEEAKAMYARWQDEAKDAANNLARFAGWMVANKYLTEYQASLLARGHADGFFINEYKVLDRLGKGRMAGVYKAQHQLGQVVAIKVLPPSKAREATLLARFQREARLALKLRHANIVRAFQVGKAGELHYLVMEHLDGETLEDVMGQRRKMPPAEAVRLIYQVLQGLQHIHGQGLVHRDLKPSNLMLVPSPPGGNTLTCTVKVLDIGLGRVLFDDGSAEARDEDAGLTGEGVLLGTPDYMAPEQARDPRVADIRADIYSLGCVLYHLLAGQPPFPDTNIISQMIRHATEAPRPLKELNAAVPDGLQQIVNWMMAKAPDGRYPTPERAAQALEVFLAAGAAPSSPDLDPKMRPFLTWLEKEDGNSAPSAPPAAPSALAATQPSTNLPSASRPPSAKPSSGTIPTAGAVKAELAKAEKPKGDKLGHAPSAKAEAKGEKRRHKKERRPPPLATPVAAPPPLATPPPPVAVPAAPVPAAPVEEESFNVELVPLGASPAGQKVFGLYLTRRDFVMYGAGVGSVLLGIAVGLGLVELVKLFRK
jgi:serine/threonine protein kinase